MANGLTKLIKRARKQVTAACVRAAEDQITIKFGRLDARYPIIRKRKPKLIRGSRLNIEDLPERIEPLKFIMITI